MQRILLVVLLTVSSAAWAGWVQMSSEDASSVTYVDPDTIKINGQLRQVTEVHDFKVPDKPRGNLSTKVVSEHDCKEGRLRVLQEDYFSGQMGSGERLGGYTGPSDWFPVVAGTRGATLHKFVCSR